LQVRPVFTAPPDRRSSPASPPFTACVTIRSPVVKHV
jgi:hypothetical protein